MGVPRHRGVSNITANEMSDLALKSISLLGKSLPTAVADAAMKRPGPMLPWPTPLPA